MLDEGCANRCGERGMRAVRSGLRGISRLSVCDRQPTNRCRRSCCGENPASYHRYFKEAGFVTERGQVDYTAPLTPEILARYRRMAEAAAIAGRYDSELARVRIPGCDSTRGLT